MTPEPPTPAPHGNTRSTGISELCDIAIGPMNRALSLSPDINNPGFRAVTFDQVRDGFAEVVGTLFPGGRGRLSLVADEPAEDGDERRE